MAKEKLRQFDIRIYDTMYEDKKVLDIYKDVEVTSYLNIAYDLSILLINPWFDEWRYENFINVYAQSWFGNTFYRVDYLDSNRFYGDLLERRSFSKNDIKPEELISFIKNKIRYDCCYVNIFALDEYYLSPRPSYMERHYVHEILVYGYDDGTEELDVLGYDVTGKFTSFKYNYNEVVRAYIGAIENAPNYPDDAIQLIKPRYIYKRYNFKLNRFVAELRNYINSFEDDKKLFYTLAGEYDTYYGIDTFKNMCRVMKEQNGTRIDMADIHVYYEHKKNLLSKFNFIDRKYYMDEIYKDLLAEYKSVVLKANKLRISYMVKRNEADIEFGYNTYLNDLAGKYEAVIAEEESITRKILGYLEEYVCTCDGENI